MVWFKIDDKFGEHPKVRAIPRTSRATVIGLWSLAGVWCASNVTTTEAQDGNVPGYMLDEFGCLFTDAAELVRVRLWHSIGHDCTECEQPRDSEGYIFHQWHTHQFTREQVLDKRAADAERQRASRARRKESRDGHAVTSSDEGMSHGTVQHPRARPVPDPSQPPITEGGQRTETLGASDTTTPPEEARCTAHTGIAVAPPCRGCKTAREAVQRAQTRISRDAEQRRQNCRVCGGDGWIVPLDGSPATKCNHLEVVK